MVFRVGLYKLLQILVFVAFTFFPFFVKAQTTLPVSSKYLFSNDTSLVFLPSNIHSDTYYPAVILLHGYGGNAYQWVRIVDLQAAADKFSMIIVSLDAKKDSWYIESQKAGYRFESFFIKEFFPKFVSLFPVDTTKVFITGFSMGGHGAIHMLLTFPDLFAGAGSMSGVLDLRSSSVTKSIEALIGKNIKTNSAWDSLSVINHVEDLKKINKPLIVDCGSEDYFCKINVDFYNKCIERGCKVVFSTTSGNHNPDYWKRMLPNHLMYFRQFANK